MLKLCLIYLVLKRVQVELTDTQTTSWSDLIDDPVQDWRDETSSSMTNSSRHEPGATVIPEPSTDAVMVPAGAVAGATSVPIFSAMANSTSSSPNSSSVGGPATSHGGNNNRASKLSWALLLLLLLLLGSGFAAASSGGMTKVLSAVGINAVQGPAGQDGQDGIAGPPGQDGQASTAVGPQGANGSAGASGANGTNGTNGTDGSNACISGLCVSRQASTPGTQETGNINIDGTILASQVGVNVTPTNTLSVGGTTNLGGHIAVGSGVTVDGGSTYFDSLGGITSHSSAITSNATLTDLGTAATAHDTFLGFTNVNSTADYSGQINGINGGIQIQSGNAKNYTGQLQGINGVTIHGGSGSVSALNGVQGILGSTGGGTIDYATGLSLLTINLSGTINNNRGLRIGTPINAGTVTNNYGIYIEDQSSVGSTDSYNIYSVGATAKNYFAGLVGIGTTPNSTYKLDVSGDARSANLYFSGSGTLSPAISDAGLSIGTASRIGSNDYRGGGYYSGIAHTFYGHASYSDILVKLENAKASGIGLVVKGAASQSANLQEWQNSSGTVLSAVDENGYLGVGTSNPNAQIEVAQSASWTSALNLTHNTPGKTLSLRTTGGATNSWNIENASGLLYFYNTSLSEPSLELSDNGNVGIGTNFAAPSSKLTVKDSASAGSVLSLQNTAGTCTHTPGAGSETVSCSSDERLKTNITDAASVLSEIRGLQVRDYTIIASGQQTTGLIAQEVLETNPDMVHLGEDGYYKVDQYNPWKLVKAIQELDTRTDFLTDDFVTALKNSQGDIEEAKATISQQGLSIDQISQTLVDYAQQLSDHEARIQALEAKIEELQQTGTSQ